MSKPSFCFDPDLGSSLCVLESKTKTYVGTAQCAEEDRDMMSEKTGCEIAYHRAVLNSLIDYRETLKNELNGLKKYYYSVCQSKQFDKKSYMAKMLNRQILMREDDIATAQDLIHQEKEYLKNYLSDKAILYKKIRNIRKAESK